MEGVRKNMSGILSRLNSVRDEKMSAAFREWPVAEYTTNASTLASAGREMAMALLAERMTSKERMYLYRETH